MEKNKLSKKHKSRKKHKAIKRKKPLLSLIKKSYFIPSVTLLTSFLMGLFKLLSIAMTYGEAVFWKVPKQFIKTDNDNFLFGIAIAICISILLMFFSSYFYDANSTLPLKQQIKKFFAPYIQIPIAVLGLLIIISMLFIDGFRFQTYSRFEIIGTVLSWLGCILFFHVIIASLCLVVYFSFSVVKGQRAEKISYKAATLICVGYIFLLMLSFYFSGFLSEKNNQQIDLVNVNDKQYAVLYKDRDILFAREYIIIDDVMYINIDKYIILEPKSQLVYSYQLPNGTSCSSIQKIDNSNFESLKYK